MYKIDQSKCLSLNRIFFLKFGLSCAHRVEEYGSLLGSHSKNTRVNYTEFIQLEYLIHKLFF